MFVHNHFTDLDTVLEQTEPFALVRYGDGETWIVEGQPYRSVDSWATHGSCWLRSELTAILRTTEDRFCLGLPTPCCLLVASLAWRHVRQQSKYRTFATIFCHGNLHRAAQVKARFSDAVVVHHRYGDIRVPKDGVSRPFDVDAVVTKLLEVDRPIWLAAGPVSNVIAHRYWRRQRPEKRVTILDVGSLVDILAGQKTRHYHHHRTAHECVWNGVPA